MHAVLWAPSLLAEVTHALVNPAAEAGRVRADLTIAAKWDAMPGMCFRDRECKLLDDLLRQREVM